jgi:flagellar basal body-associated protein FliL
MAVIGFGLFLVLVAAQVAVPRLNAWFEAREAASRLAAELEGAEPGQLAAQPVNFSALDPPLYQSLDPAFVVALNDAQGQPHYLQVGVQLMTRDEKAVDRIAQYLPAIRNNFLMRMSQMPFEQLANPTGQAELRDALLAEAQTVMEQNTGSAYIEAVYFTNLVVQ